MKRLSWFLAPLAALVGCQTPPPGSQTFNFDRPSDVALVCLDLQLTREGRLPATAGVVEPRPLTECRTDPTTGRTLDELRQDEQGRFRGRRLFAVVTQSDRGEIAAVNLQLENDGPLLDNDRRTPGFTFIPTGAFPSAVAVDPRGGVAYVANSGEQTITAVDTSRLLGPAPHRVRRDDGQFVRHQLPSYPEDVAVVERDGRVVLYATMPAAAAVLVVDVTDPKNPGRHVIVPLGAPAGGADGGGGIDAGLADGGAGGLDAGEAGGDGDGPGAARPMQLAVAEDGTVFVSDERQPVIWVLRPEGEGLAPRAPVPTLDAGVGTRALAVSPRLTAPVDGTTQFVYAVARSDGSLLVLDADTGARLRPNVVASAAPGCQPPFADPTRCLRIDPATPVDRVPLLAPATSVTFVTRGLLDPADCRTPIAPAACDPGATPTPNPRTLRGLHAVATLRSGQLQVIDVLDADRDCRLTETLPPAQPHVPRGSMPFTQAPGVPAAPTLLVNGAAVTVTPDLPRIVSRQPGVECNAANNFCIELPTVDIPGRGPTVNALAVRDETWTITYQGVLPPLTAVSGDLQPRDLPPDQLALVAPGVGFCRNGALAGDFVRLTTVGPSVTDTGFDAGLRSPEDPRCPAQLCREVFGTTGSPCNRDLDVVRATEAELVLRVRAPATTCGSSMVTTAEQLRDLVDCCYAQATRFEVHAGDGWTVVGNRSGFRHDVRAEGEGSACVGGGLGRLETNVPYESPAFTLLISAGCTEPGCIPFGAAYTFATAGGLSPLTLDVGPLPVSSLYSCINERLYVVDQARNSLLELSASRIDTQMGLRRFN